eukprot:11284855-Alexandrium_andersonii.AAC.1
MDIANHIEVILALSGLEQVLLLVLSVPPETLIVPGQGALRRGDIRLEVPLVVHTVRSGTVLLR